MDDQIDTIIRQTVAEMLQSSMSARTIQRLTQKHEDKVHFIPLKYRVVGGVLQGLNIRFGNFIEKLLSNVIEVDGGVQAMPDSGTKQRLYFTPETDALIDQYITRRQLPSSPDDCTSEFDDLFGQIIAFERNTSPEGRQGIVKDIDALFRTKDGLLVYAELKYNDDHDTGKFADINRKFIKTWAGLAVRLNITSPDELFPVLYYFNAKKRYGPIHVPSRNIMRGPQLFDRFLETEYADVDRCLAEIGDDPEILRMFDEMYAQVRFGGLPSNGSVEEG